MVNNWKNGKNWIAGAALVAVTAAPAAAQAPRNDAQQVRARQQISLMEGLFEGAVRNGADNLVRQANMVMPGAAMLTGAPEVRGFRLEGYGVFFDVAMPGLLLSPVWSLRTTMSPGGGRNVRMEPEIERLRVLANRLSGAERNQLLAVIASLESSLEPQRSRTRVAPGAVGAPGTVSAATVMQAAAPQGVDPAVLADPDDAYTREVKDALIEAMLQGSGPLALAADEWLTIAARDNAPRDPLVPGASVDFSTVEIRVKGSDLAAFHARKLTLDEAKKRVEVREY